MSTLASPAAAPSGDAGAPEPRAPLGAGQRLLHALPDLSIALVFLFAAVDRLLDLRLTLWALDRVSWWPTLDDRILWTTVVIEALFLWPQIGLVDIATRVRKRPPWWAIPPIVLVVMLFAPGASSLLPVLLDPVGAVFLPVAFSLWQRAQMLWTLPGRPVLERERARAIMGGRLNIAIAVGAPLFLVELGFAMYQVANSAAGGMSLLQQGGMTVWFAAAAYFLLAAFDHWRVGGAAFARNPRPFLWWDYVGVRDLTPGF